jgi:hypothetical protein
MTVAVPEKPETVEVQNSLECGNKIADDRNADVRDSGPFG